ncbi:hypothetical protein QWY82_09415 [Simiduia curdlanivorans]|uniref:Glycerophosphoryl diester phosphodiesterase membrane domain-containing protein n=1 Tax=Simiduia curdlanivorans TaxID=1492769 RepID=A0ABV8V727_9GAMM|nr:hypothetical protein [Simiduia curdlanivorans]MDN3639024.1 hypothetical protein [Simiduia curdlanivorans]
MTSAFPLLLDAWRFFKQHLWAISLLIIPVVIPLELVKSLLGLRVQSSEINDGNLWAGLVLGLLFAPLYQGALIHYIAAQLRGIDTGLSECFALGLRYWLPLALLYLVTGLLSIVGFLLLIFPGFFLMSRFAYADLYCVLHGMGPQQAVLKSWHDSRADFALLLTGLVVIYSAVFLASFGVSSFLQSLNTAQGLSLVLTSAIEAVLSAMFTLFAFRVFSQSAERFNSEDKLH